MASNATGSKWWKNWNFKIFKLKIWWSKTRPWSMSSCSRRPSITSILMRARWSTTKFEQRRLRWRRRSKTSLLRKFQISLTRSLRFVSIELEKCVENLWWTENWQHFTKLEKKKRVWGTIFKNQKIMEKLPWQNFQTWSQWKPISIWKIETKILKFTP